MSTTFPPISLQKSSDQSLAPPSAPTNGTPKIEQRTQEIGRTLLRAVQSQEGRGNVLDFAYNQILGIATADDKTKVELFRFTDALPALKSDESVMQHLREYLLDSGAKLPPGASAALTIASKYPLGRKFVAWASQFGAKQMAGRFIAGANAKEATAAIERLRRQNMTFTLDLLGEAVISESEAVLYQNKYLELVRDLSEIATSWPMNPRTDSAAWGAIPKVNVSVKLSSLYARFDPMAADETACAVIERLRPILRLARKNGVFVNFDMEQHDFCEITQRIFRDVASDAEFADWDGLGIVSQAYLRRSEADIIALRDFAERRGVPVTVRLVKGAYWDYETIVSAQRNWDAPVWGRKAETDACFERVSTFLIENREWLRPAIATHNVRSAAHALALIEANTVPPGSVEFQVLFGMGEAMGRALSARGERVRVYVPFGELLPGMAYLVRRLLENTSNDSFIRKSGGRIDASKLLAEPSVSALNTFASASDTRMPKKDIMWSKSASGSVPSPSDSGRKANYSQTEGLDGGVSFSNAPETDFADPAKRADMQANLNDTGKLLPYTVPTVVNGTMLVAWESISRTNPSIGNQVVTRTRYATHEDVENALRTSHDAFPMWRDTDIRERAAILMRIAAYLEQHRMEISACMIREVGKPWRDADADVAEAIDFCRFYALEMLDLDSPRHRNVPGEWNNMTYEGRGVAVIIAPWNFPLAILTGMAVAALVAGNTVILKPAEQSPRTAFYLYEALVASGAPANVVHFLPGLGETIGDALVKDARVATIAFTGSRAVGLQIYKEAAIVRPGQRELKRVVCEMGGKNAIIVDDDADLDEAVLGVVASFSGFAGQKCSACSRVIVIGAAYATFCERLSHAVRTLKIGRADDPATTLPPLVDEESVARVGKYREYGLAEGKLIAECSVPDYLERTGNYVPALVFADVALTGHLWNEEIFAPVLAVVSVPTLDDALRLALDSEYALTGGFYSRSPRNIERVRREFRVGNLYINRKITGALVDRQPFGGHGMSGGGTKAGGVDYLLNFLVPRTVTESVMRRGFAPVGSE